MPMPALLTAKQVATYLNVSKQTVYRLKLPCVVLSKRKRRWREEDLLVYISSHTKVA